MAKLSLIQNAFGCRGRLSAPISLRPIMTAILTQVGPAFAQRVAEAGTTLPGFLSIEVRIEKESRRSGGRHFRTRSGSRLVFKVPETLSLARGRFFVVHELGHVLVRQVFQDDPRSPRSSLLNEYLASRLGWEIAARASWQPDQELSLWNARQRQPEALEPLVHLTAQTKPNGERSLLRLLDMTYGQAQQLISLCYSFLLHLEAYDLGTEHALEMVLPRPALPAVLATALERLAEPLVSRPLPAHADAPAIEAYCADTDAEILGRELDFLQALPALTFEHGEEFLRFAQASSVESAPGPFRQLPPLNDS